jgi:hypothetical protein
MIDYTNRIARLMDEIVARVPALSFIDTREILVFARFGRASRDGAFATCHCLNLPDSEPTYYFWRHARTGRLLRRSEWFVSKSPAVRIGQQRVQYLVSFALPRFCNQTLARSPKASLYPGAEPWVAKLDTIVHELYHIDPNEGIRRLARSDGTCSRRSHGPAFFEDVARMVREFLASRPDPACCEFLRHDFAQLTARHKEIVGTTFRTFPSFPQRYLETLAVQPGEPAGMPIEPLPARRRPVHYTGRDLRRRQFLARSSRAWAPHARARPASRVRSPEREPIQLSCLW